MPKVLLVCLGNICRSPTAEAVMRAKVQEKTKGTDWVIESAGTGAWHRGNPPDPRSREAGEARGYDFSGMTARQVVEADFHEFDHILAMDSDNYQQLLRRCPPAQKKKVALFLSLLNNAPTDVPDPYYGGPDGFETVLDLVERGAEAWIDRLQDSA